MASLSQHSVRYAIVLSLMFLVSYSAWSDGHAPPYPTSPVISKVTFDFSARDRRAPGSDNWPITWADDGNQYAAWGDGGGFGGTNADGRVSLGVARIEGNADDYRGVNAWGGKDGESPAEFKGKSYGILSVDGVLYMWVTPDKGSDVFGEVRLAVSRDHGRHWRKAPWSFPKNARIMIPCFCEFGRDYAGARDDNVYCYATRIEHDNYEMAVPGAIDLMRVPKDRILKRDAYTFFAGMDGSGAPMWTTDVAARKAVLRDPNGTSLTSVVYDAGLKRYLLCTSHGKLFAGNLGIFDAPEPWGPWTTAGYYENWGGFGSTFYWSFAPKWFSDDGRRFVLVFTGTGHNDAWNTVPGTLSLR